MDPTPGRWGPFWTPITPEAGSLLQAVQHVDGMAGPETLAKTGAFATITAATVAAAAVKADEEAFDEEPLPELKDNAVVGASSSSAPSKSTDQIAAEMKATVEALAAAKPAAAPAPEKKSVWSKVKGWF